MANNVTLTLHCRDSLVTLLDSTTYVGTVSGNSSREAATPLQIVIAGNGAEPRGVIFDVTLDGGGLHMTDQMMVMVGSAALFDDFESNVNYWSHYGSPDLWHLQSHDYYSASHAYYCGNDSGQQYPRNANSYLRSPAFPFAGTGTLIFHTRYETADIADVCNVQLQTGTSTYQTVAHYSGSSQGWQEENISLNGLPPYDSAQLRFWFYSDASGEAEGWYLDDVILVEGEERVSDKTDAPPPERFDLVQNYHNPFNDQTTIQYSIPHQSHVSISLFNLEGRHVATLVDETKYAGVYHLSWRPMGLASGLYFIRLDASDVHLTSKMAYLK
jgi:hypothetical protein